MGTAEGFAFEQRKSGEVVIRHRGQIAVTLRGRRAAEFLQEAGELNDQELMARVTGNYRRGNERTASEHPRNRSS